MIYQYLLQPSVIALTIANAIPVIGVVSLGWSLATILHLYFLECCIAGAYSCIRLWYAEPPGRIGTIISPRKLAIKRIVFVYTFCLLYIPFLLLLSWYMQVMAPMAPGEAHYLTLSAIAFVVSHGVSHIRNFMGNQEYRKLSRSTLFSRPFLRTVVPQLFLFYLAGSSFSLETIDITVYTVVLIITGKTIVDTELHIWEHKRFWR